MYNIICVFCAYYTNNPANIALRGAVLFVFRFGFQLIRHNFNSHTINGGHGYFSSSFISYSLRERVHHSPLYCQEQSHAKPYSLYCLYYCNEL